MPEKETIRTADGHNVTKEQLDEWSMALDNDEWPSGWVNVSEVVHGRPPLSAEGSVVLSVKVPPGLKRAIESEAKQEGITISELVRSLLVDRLAST